MEQNRRQEAAGAFSHPRQDESKKSGRQDYKNIDLKVLALNGHPMEQAENSCSSMPGMLACQGKFSTEVLGVVDTRKAPPAVRRRISNAFSMSHHFRKS